MKKICEIDSVHSFAKTSYLPMIHVWSRKQVNPKWYHSHFSKKQQQFLEQHGYAIRPHPRHNPTLELFINEVNLTDRDWTVIRLLF